MTPAKKFAVTPTGSPVPITKYSTFFIATTATPASGEKISPAINAGTSLKSILRYGGRNGSGKLKNIKTKEMVPSNANTINLNKLDDVPCDGFIIQLPLHSYRSLSREEGASPGWMTTISIIFYGCHDNIKTLKPIGALGYIHPYRKIIINK